MTTYSRAQWGANASKDPHPKHLLDVPYGAVHHIGGSEGFYPSNSSQALRNIQSMEQHGEYVDIAYNWAVDRDGNLYEARGDVYDGATKGYSGTSFSVLAMCNANVDGFQPTPELISGIVACFKGAMGRGVLAADAFIEGHRWYDAHITQSPTSCCSTLEQHMHDIQTRIHGPAPVPPEPAPKVKPMYQPPLITAPLVASCNCPTNGAWAVADDGAVFTFGTAPYLGGANGKPWNVDPKSGRPRHAATIESRRYRKGLSWRWGYRITFTNGQAHNFPEGS